MEQTTELFPKVFTWLFIGLLITFVSGFALYLNESLLFSLMSSMSTLLIIVIVELVIAFVLSARIQKMNPVTMKVLYVIYCLITGLTFSSIFIVYEIGSIISIFLITALIFAVLAIYGHRTHRDLTKFGTILIFTLLGILLAGIVNIFLQNSMLDLILTSLGVLIFMGYIAYDVQKIKTMVPYVGEEKAAVYGAFSLYLDFINLLIRLLQLFGKKND